MKKFFYYLIHVVAWFLIVFLMDSTSVVHDPKIVMFNFIGIGLNIFLLTLMYSKTTVVNTYSIEYENKGHQAKDLVYILLLVVTFHLFSSFIDVGRKMIVGDEILRNDKNILKDTGLYIPFFIRNAILTPVFEEIVFRGYMYILINRIFTAIQKKRKKPKFNQRKLNIIFVIISSLIFGLLHFPDSFINAIPYVTSGVLLSCLFIITKRIWVGMLLHAINNSGAALMLVYKHDSIMSLSEQMISISACIFIGVVILLNYTKIKKIILKTP